MKRASIGRRLETLEAARVLIVAKVGTADPRCSPDHLAGMSLEELHALALEVGVMAQPGTEPQPGQLPSLDGQTAPELERLYFRGQR